MEYFFFITCLGETFIVQGYQFGMEEIKRLLGVWSIVYFTPVGFKSLFVSFTIDPSYWTCIEFLHCQRTVYMRYWKWSDISVTRIPLIELFMLSRQLVIMLSIMVVEFEVILVGRNISGMNSLLYRISTNSSVCSFVLKFRRFIL